MKVKKRLNKKKVLILFLFVICLFVFIFSILNLINWFIDSKEIKSQTNSLTDISNITEVEDSDKTEIIEQGDIPKPNPYWDYIKMNLIDVDFTELLKMNSSTAGWIQVNGTNINYPYVRANDNKYYLTHAFDKSYNDAGWVFLDYRNDKALSSQNNILYAHARTDTTMFGSLKNSLTNGWLDDTNNHVVKLSTESENTLWQVFSVYRIPTTSDYLQVDFSSDEEFLKFSNRLLKRSNYDFKTTVRDNDKILTLSTCYNKDQKVVLHAKLIKRIKK